MNRTAYLMACHYPDGSVSYITVSESSPTSLRGELHTLVASADGQDYGDALRALKKHMLARLGLQFPGTKLPKREPTSPRDLAMLGAFDRSGVPKTVTGRCAHLAVHPLGALTGVCAWCGTEMTLQGGEWDVATTKKPVEASRPLPTTRARRPSAKRKP